jgi:hypothetical protein
MARAGKVSPSEAAKELVSAPETLEALVPTNEAIEETIVDSPEVVKVDEDTAGEPVQESSTETNPDTASEELPVWIEGDPEPVITNETNDDNVVTENAGIDIPVSVEVIKDAIDNPDHIDHTDDTQDTLLEEVDQQKVFDGHIAKGKDSTEELQGDPGDLGESNEGAIVTEAPEQKYNFSEEKLDAYLSSDKPQLKIQQLNRGGNFVSVEDHEIYVPLSLFK